jgi:hypothetical protein
MKRSDWPAVAYLASAALLLLGWLSAIYRHDASPAAILMFILWIVLLVLFFVLTGFEVAYTDLRDKACEQVKPELQELLQKMQCKEESLYAAKEWFIIILTVSITLIAEWHMPFHKIWRMSLSSIELPFVLAFTTVPILWLAQGPAKRAATRNSEAFLIRLGPVTWKVLGALIWVIAKLRLDSPSTLVDQKFGGRLARNLRPSLAAYYMMSLKRFGHSNHYFSEDVKIEADGSASFRMKALVYVITSDQTTFKGHYEVDSSNVRHDGQLKILGAYWGPLPGERLAELTRELSGLWYGSPPGAAMQALDGSPNIGITYPSEQKCEFEISLPFVDPTNGGKNALVLLFEFTLSADPKAFNVPEGPNTVKDQFKRCFDWPCHEYTLNLTMDASVNANFALADADISFGGAPVVAERERIRSALRGEGTPELTTEVTFPLPGAVYIWKWEVWLKQTS